MIAIRPLFVLALLLIGAPGGRTADEPLTKVQVGKIGKAGTALVESRDQDRQISGSAFCIHPSGLFVTNEHIAQGDLQIVLNPGLKDEKVHKAVVVRSDKILDLALIRVEGVKDLPYLTLGSDEKLTELAELVAIGFPFGSDLTPDRKGYPEVSVNVGSITSLRKKDDMLHRIQLDAVLNPGNSGGPVLDMNGKVVGVVVSGVKGSGVNFAIPVSTLAKFVGRPDIEFEPPTLTPANIHKPTLFEARVVPVIPPETPLTVDLVLEPVGGPKQTHRLEAEGGKYRASPTPLTAPKGPLKVRLSAQFADGQINGTITDRTMKVGDREVRFSELHGVRPGPKPQITLADGKGIEGVVSGLADTQVQIGGQTLSMNLDRATALRFSPAVEADRVEYTLIIRQGRSEVHRQSGFLLSRGFLTASLNGPRGLAITPPLLEADKAVRKLASTVTDVAVAGGGRYLILKLASEQELAVFDVSAAEVIGHIPMRDPTARFTAGLEHVIVVLPETGKIERWDLQTLERTHSKPIPVDGEIKSVVMGSASRGPLLIHWAKGMKPLDEAPYTLADTSTFKVIEADIKSPTHTGRGRSRDKAHLRASADGKLFGVWQSGISPGGFGTIIVNESGTESYYAHSGEGYVVPGPDGKNVFTGAGRQVPKVSMTETLPRGDRELPACQGDYYLTLPPVGTDGAVSVGVLGRLRPIATVNDLDLPGPDAPSLDHDFTFDKRIHLIPDARLIIVIPSTNDRLVLRRYGG